MVIVPTIASLRKDALKQNIPVISESNAVFLQQLLMQRQPKRVLEIGSAIGVSTAIIANTVSAWGGQLVSTEISIPTQAAAKINLSALGLHNVQSLCGDARDWLALWHEQGAAPFDCVFIDAHKRETHSFYQACLPMLTDQAMVIVDDVWRYRHKMQAFYSSLAKKMQAYSLHFVDGEDATLVMRVPKFNC